MADSFFESEAFATAAPAADEAGQYDFGGYEQPGYTDAYTEQSNGGLSHADFAPGETSVFGAATEYTPAAEFDAPAADYSQPADASFFSSTAIPAPAAEPQIEDPRVQWNIQNRDYLAQKDQAERAGKADLLSKAKDYFDGFYQTRNANLQKRKDSNRTEEKEKTTTALPQGNTAWEKVHSLLNFNSDVPTKDVSRYKSTLFTCKNNNVPVKAA